MARLLMVGWYTYMVVGTAFLATKIKMIIYNVSFALYAKNEDHHYLVPRQIIQVATGGGHVLPVVT
jgi:hypothetical protein